MRSPSRLNSPTELPESETDSIRQLWGPLLSSEDVAEILRLPSAGAARKFISRSLPRSAVLRVGRRLRVRRDALLNFLGLDACPNQSGAL